MKESKAYVYAILVDGVIRYIGKGSGVPMKRAKAHIIIAKRALKRRAAGERVRLAVYADHLLAKAIAAGALVEVSLVLGDLTHAAAFAHEVAAIAEAPHGQLWNRSEGGLGAGIVSDETKRRLSVVATNRMRSAARRAHLSSLWATQSVESQQNFIDASQAARLKPGYRESMARHAKARWSDPDKAARMRNGLSKGRQAPHTKERHAKVWSRPETRQKYSDSMKRAWADPVQRAARIATAKAFWATDVGREKLKKAREARWSTKRESAV